MPKKITRKLRIFCYLGLNIGSLVLLAITALENASFLKLLIGLTSLVFMNFCFWYMFRMKERGGNLGASEQ
jgi:hypothetical protein